MDPITGAMVVGGAANLLGGLYGASQAQPYRHQANGILPDIYKQYKDLQIPNIAAQQLALEQYKSAGAMSPTTEQAAQLNAAKDALQNIQIDPRLRQAQFQQLATLQKLGDTGLTPVQVGQLKELENQVNADQTSRMKAMIEQQNARGTGSSDSALAAKLAMAQSAANQHQTAANNMAATAFQNALQAKAQAGNLGNQMEQTSYGQQAALANALNNREYQNFMQQAASQQRNVDRFNQAQMFNLQNNQNLNNMNTNLSNQQQQFNKGLYQQQFQNNLSKLSGMQGAGNTQANNLNNNANATAGMWSGLGQGVGNAASAYGQHQNNQNWLNAFNSQKAQSSPGNQNSNGMTFAGNSMAAYQNLAKGAIVEGNPIVSGDSEKNDIVPAKLSPGELVVPRSVVEAGPDEIKKFAEKLLELHNNENSGKSIGEVLAHKAYKSR